MERFALTRRQRLLSGVALSVGSLLFIGIGLFAVVSALSADPVQLPSEGTIEDIVGESERDIPLGRVIVPDEPRKIHGPVPVRMEIPLIGVDAPVITLGLIEGTNIPDVPNEGAAVGWYDFSATPGLENNAVFGGHVDWQTASGSPIAGVFYRLRELHIGDEITVELENEELMTYRVTGNVATEYDDPNIVKAMDFTSRDVITLITCGGSWVEGGGALGGNYSHRIVVRAELATDSDSSVSNGPS